MNAPKLHLAAVFVAASASLAGCRNGDKSSAASAAGTSAAGDRVATVFFTTGALGYVEPCGCTSKPLGGVHRLAAVIRAAPTDRALVDTGSLLFDSEPLDAISGAQHRLKADLLARVYRELGAVAINVGATDLADGVGRLKALQREGAVPLVSANVRPVGDAGPSIAQSFLRTVGGIKIGITGVATPEAIGGFAGVAAIEHTPAVRAEVKMLKQRGAEVVVVLADLSAGVASELARAIDAVDVIVRGPGTEIGKAPSAPLRVGNAVIVEAGRQGQHVGKLILNLGPKAPRRPIALDDGGAGRTARRALVERKIAALTRQIDGWKADASKAEAIAARQEKIEALTASLAAPAAGGVIDGPHMLVEIVPLTDDITGDPAINTRLEVYYAKQREMNLDKGDPAKCAKTPQTKSVYVGSAECNECHEEAYEFWKNTKHAVAWATLEDQNKHFDLTCIGCHTVGYEQPGGFCKLSEVGVLKDVGCENCHGPGSLHSEEGDIDLISLAVTEATCAASCHVPEHSDEFEFGKYIQEITGEGHELASSLPAKP